MSKSLQEQLLTLGLASEKPRKKRPGVAGNNPNRRAAKADASRREARKKNAVASESSDRDVEMDLARAYALRKREEQQQAEAARKRKQEEDRLRRELNKNLGAIVKMHRLNDSQAEVARNFMYKGRIRKIHLTPEQLKSLNQGDLGVVYLSGGYHLLAPEHVEAIRQLSAEHVPDLGGASDDDDDHPVPDDLTW